MEPLRNYEGDVWDRRQESRLNIGEAVTVKRLDRGWLYVNSEATEGYVREEGIFVCSRRHYERYRELQRREYRIVLKSGRCRDGQYVRVGTVLPALDWDGEVMCRSDAPVLVGNFLPFTERQIRLQMERMLGIPYSWGDERVDGLDCSSTVRAFYACFGVMLPRNSEAQREYGEQEARRDGTDYKDLKGMTSEEKRKQIQSMGVGTVLHMPGHVMLYAGDCEETPLIFHNCDTYVEREKEIIVRKCIISEFLPKETGTYLDYVISAWRKKI